MTSKDELARHRCRANREKSGIRAPAGYLSGMLFERYLQFTSRNAVVASRTRQRVRGSGSPWLPATTILTSDRVTTEAHKF